MPSVCLKCSIRKLFDYKANIFHRFFPSEWSSVYNVVCPSDKSPSPPTNDTQGVRDENKDRWHYLKSGGKKRFRRRKKSPRGEVRKNLEKRQKRKISGEISGEASRSKVLVRNTWNSFSTFKVTHVTLFLLHCPSFCDK